ncbi:spore coat protein CotJB [Geosporobacter ferrireducens]|uniref:Spore coat protein CotJB n=1 Tax=Geosporobacter ferrireducens TaxID=1424294 RepID=A0A1D8GMR9_9FIRM|nr:spore coat protein CotJB [Geosporobacter ferrireducens]AOT72209.1 spore coat protein CotJB [Geosporobacter ferrireducens]MTI56102.1 spore coat protein CotJB [Geosporobacter ferrireducens]
MEKERVEMLRRIQEVEFACIDLNLYLDTHPTDKRALMDYNSYTYQLMMLKKQYESIYGPMTNFGYAQSQYPWAWIEDPWPWEIEY